MKRARLALLAPLLLAACGPTDEQVAGAVLLSTPLVYVIALGLCRALHGQWAVALPGLQFGRGSHLAALVLCVGLAVFGGRHADPDLFGLALWWFGGSALALWLVLARLTVRSGWGFRWGGIVAVCGLAMPMVLGLIGPPEPLIGWAALIYLYFGGLGLTPVLLLLFMVIEGVSVARAARARDMAAGTGPSEPAPHDMSP